MKKQESDQTFISRITNGTAKSSSWDKMATASGVVYVGSRGPSAGLKFGSRKKIPLPNATIRKVAKLSAAQRLEHQKALPAQNPMKKKPESKYLRAP